MACTTIILFAKILALGSIAACTIVTAILTQKGVTHLMKKCTQHSQWSMLMPWMFWIQKNHDAVRFDKCSTLLPAASPEVVPLDFYDSWWQVVQEEEVTEDIHGLQEDLVVA